MAYLVGRLVQVVHPQNGATDVAIDSAIKVMFSKDMSLSSINSNTIRIIDQSGNVVPCSVSMDPTSPSRLVVVTPSSALLPGSRYQASVVGGENGVRTVDLDGNGGQFMLTDYLWNFTTDTKNVLSAPKTVYPVNNSIENSSSITFSWEEVSGASHYHLQISKTNNFSIIFFEEENISDTSYFPNTDLAPPYDIPDNYYWRVRAVDNFGSYGMWSSVNQMYLEENIGTPVEFEDYSFSIVNTFPAVGKSEVDLSTSEVIIEFSNIVNTDSVTNDSIFVKAKDIDGGLLSSTVETLIDVTQNKVIISILNPLKENTEYEVYIGKDIASINGSVLGEESMFMFMTVPSPYYSTIEIVRNDLGKFIEDFSDIDISKTVYGVSLWADQIASQPYGSVNNFFPGETQSQTTNKIFFHEYVRYESDLRLLMRRALEHSITKGESIALADFQKQATSSLVPELNIVMKRLEQNRDLALHKLTIGKGTASLPTFAVLGNSGAPYPLGTRRF